ncbi:hypothetical protein AVEN_8512-1, partial [Araneus ventricosus]
VQPCSEIGCGSWSDELDATTSDGMADPPENIEMRCFHDNTQNINYVVVTWDEPKNIRGTVQAYNVSILLVPGLAKKLDRDKTKEDTC